MIGYTYLLIYIWIFFYFCSDENAEKSCVFQLQLYFFIFLLSRAPCQMSSNSIHLMINSWKDIVICYPNIGFILVEISFVTTFFPFTVLLDGSREPTSITNTRKDK